MYGFHDYVPLSTEEILLRVTQEEIFGIVYQPVIGEFITSPLRNNDFNAGCYFEWYGQRLFFIDFGYTNIPLDCFGFIGAYYGLNYRKVLELINEHFKLGLGNSGYPVKPAVLERVSAEKVPKNTQIIFHPRQYDTKDGQYWSQFGIRKSQLITDRVFAVRWYKVLKNGVSSVIRPIKPSYAYFEFNPRVKIYCPTTKNYSQKWITNCNRNDIGNINNISVYGLNLLITKSYKDCRVIRNLGKKDVVWFQNEGTLPDIPIITSLCKRFQTISVLFDNDDAGIKALDRVVTAFNSYSPGKAEGFITSDYNDPAEFYRHAGENPLREFLKAKNLL